MMKYNLYVEDVSVEAVFNKLGGIDGARRFLRDEIVLTEPERSWHEKDGVIYFSVTSDGTTGPEWIKRLEKKRFRISDCVRSILLSFDFKPTSAVTYHLAVLRGGLFEDSRRITKNIRESAYSGEFTDGQKLFNPNAEAACLIREKFMDEELKAMGLWWIVTMHKPIEDFDDGPGLLCVGRDGNGCWLGARRWGGPGDRWHRRDGFAFVVSQVSSQD